MGGEESRANVKKRSDRGLPPRGRGRVGFSMLSTRTILGLPPRGRGRVDLASCALVCAGITPAWAGKRIGRSSFSRSHGDYPRVGGEETFPPTMPNADKGLPPRGRGRVHAAIRGFAHMGITPAWAGKSAHQLFFFLGFGDYPRVGGEEGWSPPDLVPIGGLPPRGRGRAPLSRLGEAPPGITPAWAGKSSSILCHTSP